MYLALRRTYSAEFGKKLHILLSRKWTSHAELLKQPWVLAYVMQQQELLACVACSKKPSNLEGYPLQNRIGRKSIALQKPRLLAYSFLPLLPVSASAVLQAGSFSETCGDTVTINLLRGIPPLTRLFLGNSRVTCACTHHASAHWFRVWAFKTFVFSVYLAWSVKSAIVYLILLLPAHLCSAWKLQSHIVQ